jgi:hypothetical protein
VLMKYDPSRIASKNSASITFSRLRL